MNAAQRRKDRRRHGLLLDDSINYKKLIKRLNDFSFIDRLKFLIKLENVLRV